MRRQKMTILCSIFLASLLVVIAPMNTAIAAEFHVGPGQTYATIQAGVDAAGAGDDVIVHDGLYAGNVQISTPMITLRSLDFINNGENDDALIDAGTTFGIEIITDGVTVEGFSVYGDPGSCVGIRLFESDGCKIAFNRCGWEEDVHRNQIGIELEWSNSNLIENNATVWNHARGIALMESSRNTVRHNTSSFTDGTSWACGICIYGPDAQFNLIQNNDLETNYMGILVANLATRNTCDSNTIIDSYWGVYNDGWHNVYSNNIVLDSVSGIHVRNSQFWSITGNSVDGCQYGIRLGFGYNPGGANGQISFNRITNNTIAGVTINYNSVLNVLFMNHFAGNTANVISDGTDWNMLTPCSYFYGGNQSNTLGNYYDTYIGIDTDGDGIGDTGLPFDDGDPVQGPYEMFPLISPPTGYDLQAWFLGGPDPAVMTCGNVSQVVDQLQLTGSESFIWISDLPAGEDIDFASGSWSGRMVFVGAPASEAALLEVGTSIDGSDFTPSGAEISIGAATAVNFTTSAAPVSVSDGQHLALRLTNTSMYSLTVQTGGARTYLTSPGLDDPRWPGSLVGVKPVTATRLSLWQNYPNPFNPTTLIRFDLPATSPTHLRIFDISGRLVRVLVNGETLDAGSHKTVWNGKDDAGRHVATGVYFYRLKTPAFVETKRMALLR